MLQALNSCLPKHYWTISSWRNVVFFLWSCASYLFKTRLPRPRLQRQAMKHRKKNQDLTADNIHGMVQCWMQSMYREGRDGWSLKWFITIWGILWCFCWRLTLVKGNFILNWMFLFEPVDEFSSCFIVGKCITFYAIFWEVGFFHIQV